MRPLMFLQTVVYYKYNNNYDAFAYFGKSVIVGQYVQSNNTFSMLLLLLNAIYQTIIRCTKRATFPRKK